jgi:hypothetical protein
MAWLVGDGFDFYVSITDMNTNQAVWQSGTFQVINAGGRFGLGAYCQLGNNSLTNANITTIQFANSSTLFVNMNIRANSAHVGGGTTQIVGFTLRDTSSNIQCGLFLRNGGDFVLTSGGIGSAVLATSPVLSSSAGVWMHIQAKIVIHNTAGSIELRHTAAGPPPVASTPWIATGLNTRNGTANFYANVVHLTATFTGTTANEGLVDDFYVFNDQGAVPNDWQGDVFAVQQMPVSDVGTTTWDRNSGTNNCLAVDDPQEDGDATYVATDVVNNVDTYALSQLITTPASIIAVALKYISRMDAAGPHKVTAQLKSGPTIVALPNYDTIASYVYQQQVFVTDPNTSAPWSADAVNALNTSIKLIL